MRWIGEVFSPFFVDLLFSGFFMPKSEISDDFLDLGQRNRGHRRVSFGYGFHFLSSFLFLHERKCGFALKWNMAGMFPFPVFYPLSVKCIDSLPRAFCVIFVKNRLTLCESSVFIFFIFFTFTRAEKMCSSLLLEIRRLRDDCFSGLKIAFIF